MRAWTCGGHGGQLLRGSWRDRKRRGEESEKERGKRIKKKTEKERKRHRDRWNKVVWSVGGESGKGVCLCVCVCVHARVHALKEGGNF